MPASDYICEECGKKTKSTYVDIAPEYIECRICESNAFPEIESDKGYKTKGSIRRAVHEFSCGPCGHKFDAVVAFYRGETTADEKECPKCDGPSMVVWTGMRIDTSSCRYPYWDRGLGQWVRSKDHRKEICDNPRRFGINADKLAAVDGDVDLDKVWSAQDQKDRESKEMYNEYVDMVENAPAFAQYRKERDRKQELGEED